MHRVRMVLTQIFVDRTAWGHHVVPLRLQLDDGDPVDGQENADDRLSDLVRRPIDTSGDRIFVGSWRLERRELAVEQVGRHEMTARIRAVWRSAHASLRDKPTERPACADDFSPVALLSAEQVMTPRSPQPRQWSITAATAASHGLRSASVRGWPFFILATFSGGWRSSPSSNFQHSRSARRRPIVLLPAPEIAHDDGDRRDVRALVHGSSLPASAMHYAPNRPPVEPGSYNPVAQPELSRVPRKTVGPLGARPGEPPGGSRVTTSSPVPISSRASRGDTAIRFRPDCGKRPSWCRATPSGTESHS